MGINVSAVQFEPILNEYEKNINRMCDLIDQTMEKYPKTQLIVFPELATTGYESDERFQEFAEVVGEPGQLGFTKLGEAARKHGIYLVYGFAQRDKIGEPTLHNSAALIDDRGECIGVYQKVQLFAGEKKWFDVGNTYPVFETPLGKIGIFICFDTLFPEIARIEGLKGADIFIVPTNWEAPFEDDMEKAMSARALDNTLPLVCCNRLGYDKSLGFRGFSRIVDPRGNIITQIEGPHEGIINAELDYEVTKRWREKYYTYYADRRPETYSVLTRDKKYNYVNE